MTSKARLFSSPTLNMILIYFSSFLVIFLNVTIIKSSVVGFVSSMIYVYISSLLCGNAFFKDEGVWHKILLGFSVFIVLLSLASSLVLGLYRLTPMLVVLVLFAIASLLVVLNVKLYGFKALFTDIRNAGDERLGDAVYQKFHAVFSAKHVLQVLYIMLLVASFLLLLMSRSGEVKLVWDVIHPAFLPLFSGATFVLLMVLFSKAGKGIKLFYVILHSFLVHSILVIVMNPGLHGDQFYELAFARDIFNRGRSPLPSLSDFLFGDVPGTLGGGVSASLFRIIYFVGRKRAYQAPVVVFANMFGVDVYWTHSLLTPVLWAIIVPFVTYKIIKMLGGKESSSIIGAFLTMSVTTYIAWGIFTIPDTLGKVFFFLAVYFALKYVSFHETKFSFIFLSFLATSAAFLAEFMNGVLAFVPLFLAIPFRKYQTTKNTETKVLLTITTVIGFIAFPVAFIPLGEVRTTPGYVGIEVVPVSFNLEKLLKTDVLELVFGSYLNSSVRVLLPLVFIPLLGFIGLFYVVMFAPKQRYNRSLVLFLVLIVTIFVVDYRIIKYAMTGLPFTKERMYIFRDLLILPFAAILGTHVINELYSRMRSPSFHFRRFHLSAFSLMILISCFAFSQFNVLVTRDGCAVTPYVLQPTPYEAEAIEYIHRNTPGRYVVLCDGIFRNWALGMLGMQYASYYTGNRFYEMLSRPSVDALVSTMRESGASVGYFAISIRFPNMFDSVVESARKIFGVYGVFGDEKLYVFRYPREFSRVIPLVVDSGNYSRVNYVLEYELNITHLLSETPGHLDPNSVRVVASDGSEVPTQFDYFQGWFDDCSTSDNWSGGTSDGDVLTYTMNLTAKFPEVSRLRYTKLEMDGGDLSIDVTKYKYIEVKWSENLDGRATIRFGFCKKDPFSVKYIYAKPRARSPEWDVWRYDISALNGTLVRWIWDIYDWRQTDWVGQYMLYIDWIRFVSDTGTVRFLYSGAAHTTKTYQIEYETLENAESGNRDHLPKKSYPNGISTRDEVNFYNFTWNWDGRVVNFLVNKAATTWIGAPGETFSYSLQIDDVNILTSDDSNKRGGMGIMQTSDFMSNISVAFKDAQLICDGPVMTEVLYETNGYGNLYIRFYQGEYPRILFRTEGGNSTVGSTYGNYAWLVSTNTMDDKVYYLKDDGTVGVGDLSGNESSGTWLAQSLGQYEANGYLILSCSLTEIVANYSASYNNFGFDTQDYMFYSGGSIDDTNFMYVIGKDQSIEEIGNITLEIKNVPLIDRWRAPNSLTMRVVDLLNQPVPEVEIEVRELGMKAVTDMDGWATVSVPEGQWTLVASKSGVTNQKEVDVFANTVTLQRLNIIKIEMITFNILESVLVFGLILIGVVFLLVLINRRARISRTSMEQ